MQQLLNALAQAAPQRPANTDKDVAAHTAHALLAAVAAASDPELKAALSKALAALHSYVTKQQKEHENAMAGKMSPRHMAQAHGAQ